MNEPTSATISSPMRAPPRLWIAGGYLAVVLIWGTTWIAIGTQVEGTSVHVAVGLRLACASLIFFGVLAALKLPWRLRRDQLRVVIVQGVCFYGINYIAVYTASQYLTSGVLAIVFSITVPFNLIVGWLIERKRPAPAAVLAVLLGVSGIALVFGAELASTRLSGDVFRGASLAVFAALTVAVGNVLAAGRVASEIGMLRVNAYGFAFGTLAIVVWGVASGSDWSLTITSTWALGFSYLLLVGSVLALAIYMKILPRIGFVAGAYTVVLSPVIALVISSIFEQLAIGASAALGVVLLLVGHSILILGARR